MKPVYERENLRLTEFDAEDVITTSGVTAPEKEEETDNIFGMFRTFNMAPGSWF